MKTWFASLLLFFPSLLAAQGNNLCAIYNTFPSGGSQLVGDTTHHVTGSHGGALSADYSCTYSGTLYSTPCQVTCSSLGSPNIPAAESGTLTSPPLPNLYNTHTPAENANGATVSSSGTASCGVLGEVAVRECPYIVNNSCPFAIVVQNTGIGNTGGFSSTPSGATPLWAGNNFTDQYTCPAKIAPASRVNAVFTLH